jgi:hypothetical protein
MPASKIKFVQLFMLSTINSSYNTVTFTLTLPSSKKQTIHSNTLIVVYKTSLYMHIVENVLL